MDKRSLSGSKFIREGAIISVLTMLGKVTGFLREWSFAFFFGTSLIVDAIRIAIDLSTYVFTLLSGRTMEAVFVPLVVRWRTRGLVRSTDLLSAPSPGAALSSPCCSEFYWECSLIP